jgi:hypothetical protein
VAVGLERAHAQRLGTHQRLPVARLGLLNVGSAGVSVDSAQLEQRVRLVATCLQLSGPVERLTSMLPGLVAASGEEIDRAELPEVADIMAAQRTCAEVVPARLL